MRKLLILLIAVLFVPNTYADTETPEYRKAAENLKKHYNAEEYEKIVAMFSLTMMQAVPNDEANKLFTRFSNEAGKLLKMEFKSMQGQFAVYKGTYEKTTLGINIALNQKNEISGLYFNEYIEDESPELVRNESKMILPFEGKWFTFWGGTTKEQNYHIDNRAQRYAFDFVITDEKGSTHKGDGTSNEDYYCFGKKILAPCDAEVVLAVTGVKDNKPGVMNPYFPTGNTLILKTEYDEYIVLAHFKQGSVKVKQGDSVKQGDLLGLCGNSGNSSEAHLHFHIQNKEDLNTATGAQCYFEKILVDGKPETDHMPVKGQTVEQSK